MHYWHPSFVHFSAKRFAILQSYVMQRNALALVVRSYSNATACHGRSNKPMSIPFYYQINYQCVCTIPFYNARVLHRSIFISSQLLDKSKLEDSLIEKQKKKKASSSQQEIVDTPVFPEIKDKVASTTTPAVVSKPPLLQRIWTEIKHYYHGFRLLFLDVRIASRTLWKIMRGKKRTRREHNQFTRAVADIFRLVPFSVFIIIPFAEIALPFVLKFFPGMLPSTFETSSKKETRLKQELKVKLEMAKFLQDTVEDIAVHANKKGNVSKNFVEFFQKARTSNQQPTNEEILLYAKLFKDELTLSNINRPQLVAMCRLLQVTVPTVGTNEFLRLLLEMKLNSLHRDDELIMQEGVDSLTTSELMQACQARGMRALGVPRKRLKQQLSEWIDLHLNHNVPSSLLLLSRVLYLPESVPTEEKVKAVISTLPDKAGGEAEVIAGELNLERVDNTARYKVAKLEHTEIIGEEAQKAKQEKIAKVQVAGEVEKTTPAAEKTVPLIDAEVKTAEKTIPEGPVLVDTARVIGDDNKITQEEIDVIDDAISKLSPADAKDTTAAAKTELNELKEDVEEYKTDVKTLTDEMKEEEHTAELRDTKAGQLLQKRIGKMISKMEVIIQDLEKTPKKEDTTENQVAISDMVHTMHSLTKLPHDKLKRIFDVLDSNKDGHIDVTEARNIIKLLNQEDVEVTAPQLEQIVKLLASKETVSSRSNPEESKITNAAANEKLTKVSKNK